MFDKCWWDNCWPVRGHVGKLSLPNNDAEYRRAELWLHVTCLVFRY